MHSKAQVKRAGKVLREHYSGRLTHDAGAVAAAWSVLEENRGRWSDPDGPLDEVLGVLKRIVGREAFPVFVAARVKTAQRIIEKMNRGGTALTRLQDVGGCRVVADDHRTVREVQGALLSQWPEARVDDYIASPKSTGYRAVHVIVESQGLPVEIQLRTRRLHAWATLVEKEENRIAQPLKYGKGDPVTLAALRWLADRWAAEELGGGPEGTPPPPEVLRWLARGANFKAED